jgi:enediyne biosynthesis protein E7
MLDTTSALLSWAMTFLSRDATIVNNIREEVKNVVGDRAPEYSDVQNLHYCSMVLRECLRMRPPVHTIDRFAVEDCEIAGKQLPANVSRFSPLLNLNNVFNVYFKM